MCIVYMLVLQITLHLPDRFLHNYLLSSAYVSTVKSCIQYTNHFDLKMRV